MRYIRQKFVQLIFVVFAVTIFTFLLLSLLPGDRAVAIGGVVGGEEAEAYYDQVREQWGLNDPLIVQYFTWLKNAVTGDLGVSSAFNVPVVRPGERPPPGVDLADGVHHLLRPGDLDTARHRHGLPGQHHGRPLLEHGGLRPALCAQLHHGRAARVPVRLPARLVAGHVQLRAAGHRPGRALPGLGAARAHPHPRASWRCSPGCCGPT